MATRRPRRTCSTYFQTPPRSVHQMVLTLGRNGLIARIPGAPRSIRVLLDRSELPDLD
jgi:hypothetical protein